MHPSPQWLIWFGWKRPFLRAQLISLAVAGLLATICPNLGERFFARFQSRCSRLASRPWFCPSLLFCSTLLVALLFGLRRQPVPAVHDEFSYLLAGRTFYARHLANPAPPAWPSLQTFHEILSPAYQSKYPPMQGVFLALGLVFGRAIVGVWISAALAVCSLYWMLAGWISRSSAFAMAVLVLAVTANSYWAQSFWGGMLAFAGGSLVYGALPRILQEKPWFGWPMLSAGLLLLANSRPYEGLLVSLPVLFRLAWAALHGKFSPAASQVAKAHRAPFVSALTLLAAGFAWMGFYNFTVTGSPWQMPYMLYTRQFDPSPIFRFQTPRPFPAYLIPAMAEFYHGVEHATYLEQMVSFHACETNAFLLLSLGRLLLGPALLLLVLLSPLGAPTRKTRILGCALALFVVWFAAGGSWWFQFQTGLEVWISVLVLIAALLCWTAPELLIPVAGSLAVLAGVYLSIWQFPHYAAPMAAPFLLLCAAGLRVWWRSPWGRPVLRWMGLGMLVSLGVALAITPRPRSPVALFGRRRARIARLLAQQPRKQLVFVSYGPFHNLNTEWVFNRPAPASAQVVWAHKLDTQRNRQLVAAYPDRQVWLLCADFNPPALRPYPASCHYPSLLAPSCPWAKDFPINRLWQASSFAPRSP